MRRAGPRSPRGNLAAGLNNEKVRVALHVPPEAFYGHPFSLITPLQYTRTVPSLVDTYLRIIPKTKVLVFNGDLDPCVPYNGNEEWTRGRFLASGLILDVSRVPSPTQGIVGNASVAGWVHLPPRGTCNLMVHGRQNKTNFS